MRKLLIALSVLVCMTVSAQTHEAPQTPPLSKRWGSLGATAALPGTGLSLGYGEQDFFAPGTDARFSVRYFSDMAYSNPSFGLEFRADALAYTYDPDPTQSLALVAYGGLGPRFIVLAGIPDYASINYDDPAYYENPNYVTPTMNAYLINIGGLGGLEARLGHFGLFLEVDLSLPTLGLVGPRFRALPLDVGTTAELTIGANYYF